MWQCLLRLAMTVYIGAPPNHLTHATPLPLILIYSILFIIIMKEIERVDCLLSLYNIVSELFLFYLIFILLTPSPLLFLETEFWAIFFNPDTKSFDLKIHVTSILSPQTIENTSQHPKNLSNLKNHSKPSYSQIVIPTNPQNR